MAGRKRTCLNYNQVLEILDYPSDSEDDLVGDDSDLDPDYSPDHMENADATEEDLSVEEPTSDDPSNVQTSEAGLSRSAMKKKSEREIIWYANKDNSFAGNPPVFQSDLKVNIHGEHPVDYFIQLVPETLLTEIVFQSNLYATEKGKETFCLTVPELKIFLGINFIMTYVRYARIRQYWSADSGLRLNIIANAMSVNRFEEIRKYLHFKNRSEILEDNTDKLIRLRPFLDVIHKTFHDALDPEESHSIDEMMIPFKGRSSIKQYIKSKPKPWGFKIWVHAGVSGYVYCFEPYQGARKEPPSEFGPVGDSVIRLCHGLEGHNHKLYFDNLFTTIPLTKKLEEMGIFVVGTVRSNRLRGANNKLKSVKDLEKEGRGAVSVVTSADNISVTRWLDNRPVHVLSTYAGLEPQDLAKRYCKKTKTVIEVNRPFSVQVYNQHMGGVDLMDSLVALYRHSLRHKRFYMRIFHHLLNVAVVNCWLLWRFEQKDKMDLLEFKSRIATGLLYSGEAGMAAKKRGRPSLCTNDNVSKKKKSVFGVVDELRFGGGSHFPKKSEGKFALKCKNSKCPSKTRYTCDMCNVHLCPECFREFHTK